MSCSRCSVLCGLLFVHAVSGALPQPDSVRASVAVTPVPSAGRPLSDTVRAPRPSIDSVQNPDAYDSSRTTRLVSDSARRDSASDTSLARDSSFRDTTPQTPRFFTPSFGWSIGAGAPTFPLRDRFTGELGLRATKDTLVVDQPYDGSQLGFSTGLELGLQHDFVRGIVGAEWSFWDGRAVARNPRTEELVERMWRVDQLMGLAGVDLIIPSRLLTVTGAFEPHLGIRAAYGIGRLVGTGRAWTRGGGWQAFLGADAASYGPLVIGGRLGWNSLSLDSDRPMSHVLYDNVGADDVEWNGSGLWLNLTLRLRPPPAAKAAKDSAPRTRIPPAAMQSTRVVGLARP